MTYNEYLKKEKKKKIIILSSRILLFVIIIFLWQFFSSNNIIDSFIFSSPKKIIITIIKMFKENNLLLHIYTTTKEIIISFIITCFLSIIISTILYTYDYLYKVLDPFLTMLNSLPKVSLGPIIIICIGANTKSIIVMSILISLIVSIQTILIGFQNTDKLKIKLLKTFNASKKDILFSLVIPSNKNTIINSFKINISMCLIGTITGEFLTSKSGIGYLILYGFQIFNLDIVMSGIILLVIISIIFYKIVSQKK